MTLKKVTVPDSGQDPNIVYTQNWNDFVDAFTPVEQKSHENTLDHSNSLDHSHTNKTLLDTYTQTEADVADAVSKKHADHESPLDHEHANKTLLDSYTQTEIDLSDAVSKKHSNNLDHSNSLDHANTNDPTSDQKSALAGTNGAPSTTNKYVTDSDPRNSDARTPSGHNQDASTINAGTLDGDRLPALSTTKKGGVPATGTPSGKFLKDDDTWATPAGGGGLGYNLHVQALTSSPADSVSAYFGQLPKAPTTTANTSKVYVRKAGTIKMANIYCYSGTAGTAEAWSLYIRVNNTTDTLIATLSASTSERVFTNSALNIAVAAGDYFEIKSVQPAWATNPLTTIYGGYVYIE